MARKTSVLTIIVMIIIVSSFSTIGQDQQPQKVNVLEKFWTNLINDRQNAIETLPTYVEFAENATSWADYADKTFSDLLVYNDSWSNPEDNADGIKGFRPYVANTDWKYDDGSDGAVDGTRQITELMAGIDVLWPMYRYLELHPNTARQVMVDEFIQELPKYFNPDKNQSANRPGETRHDSWYFMENSVLKYGHLYYISEEPVLELPYFGSLESGIQAAKNFNYLFPQFFYLNLQSGSSRNVNYGTAGLLAYSLIHAYELTGNVDYLLEAEKALIAMRGVEPYKLIYEPQELAAAVAAAAQLTNYTDKLATDTDFSVLAQEFFYAQQQQLYYDNGKTDLSNFGTRAQDAWRDGLNSPYYNWVEAGGINAPAYKESIESTMLWMDYLRYLYFDEWFNAEEPLKILNLNRIKTFNFFSPNIPDSEEREWGPTTLQYIPYEDIDWQDYKPGENGKEIYGAGETFWNYLMFEALGTATDRNALILNLNMFEKDYPKPIADRVYVVWNPYDNERQLEFTLKNVTEPYSLYVNGTLYLNLQPTDSFDITLPGKGSAYLTFDENKTPPAIQRTLPRTITEVITINSQSSTDFTSSSGSISSSESSETTNLMIFSPVLAVLLIVFYRKRRQIR
ncbi:MAG: hypothetical protein ACXAC7_03940 [Candidatus Hodarchaeales archaeon]